MAILGAGLDHVGKFVVGASAGTVEMIEGRIQGRLVVPLQQALDDPGQPPLPENILDPAAGQAQLGGQADQLFGVGGLLGAAGKAGTFHGVPRKG
jgi:hypothetical protein